ncbi:MAG TPA: hypothetical protein VKT30_13050 [Caulobacteraceae bacterium]|nr:hypothetical protein [Caulobacteraceae bacterium]
MAGDVVIALYRPHPGADAEMKRLIDRHVPTLRRLELVSDRQALLLKAADGTYLEIFEWVSAAAQRSAHEHPEVAHIWEAMEAVGDFVSLDALEESHHPFSHFAPVD